VSARHDEGNDHGRQIANRRSLSMLDGIDMDIANVTREVAFILDGVLRVAVLPPYRARFLQWLVLQWLMD
jgi:hypothetical protein